MNAQRKFVDRDILADPSLVTTATIYAVNYHGEFEFMLAAKAAAQSSGTLPLPVARGVLNCMRVDPTAAHNLPALPDWGPGDGAVANVTPIRRQERTPQPPRPRRPFWHINTPVTNLKAKAVASAHKQAYVYHPVIEGSFCQWQLAAWDEDNPNVIIRKPVLHIHTECAKHYYGNIRTWESEAAAEADGYRLCAGCNRVRVYNATQLDEPDQGDWVDRGNAGLDDYEESP